MKLDCGRKNENGLGRTWDVGDAAIILLQKMRVICRRTWMSACCEYL